MRRYLRSRSGRIYFFTVVTHERRPILTSEPGRRALGASMRAEQAARPFKVVAMVLLPDHLHAIWEMPEGDPDYSTRWRRIKGRFSRLWAPDGERPEIGASRRRKAERDVWQRRFYEHTCRDERDLKRCVDYVHINPVKHGLVRRAVDWPWSSFHRHVRLGEYPPDWGGQDIWFGDEFRDLE